MGGHRRRVLEPHRAFIVDWINPTSDLTLHRLKDELAARGVMVSHNAVWQFLRREGLKDELAARGVMVSHNAVWQFLRREGLSFKKTLFALEQSRATLPAGANVGAPGRVALIRNGSSSSMRVSGRSST
ncbi:hypothetical protein X737_35320 [Mesorhizobium sp. L48C026A00]|nr:hypothetical protein X737_35320 [Mesorhizobium sp. L48C026A00]